MTPWTNLFRITKERPGASCRLSPLFYSSSQPLMGILPPATFQHCVIVGQHDMTVFLAKFAQIVVKHMVQIPYRF